MGRIRKLVGWVGKVWDELTGRYIEPEEVVKIDEQGVKRDFGETWTTTAGGSRGPGFINRHTRVGLPGEDRSPGRDEDKYERMGREGPNSAAYYRGLDESLFKFDDKD
jgi:hypothetical protein